MVLHCVLLASLSLMKLNLARCELLRTLCAKLRAIVDGRGTISEIERIVGRLCH